MTPILVDSFETYTYHVPVETSMNKLQLVWPISTGSLHNSSKALYTKLIFKDSSQYSQRHTFDLKPYWPGGPVRFQTWWSTGKNTGPANKFCAFNILPYFMLKKLQLNIHCKFMIQKKWIWPLEMAPKIIGSLPLLPLLPLFCLFIVHTNHSRSSCDNQMVTTERDDLLFWPMLGDYLYLGSQGSFS